MRKTFFLGLLTVLAGAAAIATPGFVTLPTEWHLMPPTSTVVPTKTFPESAVRTSDGAHLIVVEGGAGSPGIGIFATRDLSRERDVALENVYGVPLADVSGSGFWVGTGADDSLLHVDAMTGRVDRTIALPRRFWPAGIGRAPDGKTLAVSGDLAGTVVLVDLVTSKVSAQIRVGSLTTSATDAAHDESGVARGAEAAGDHPAGVVFSDDGRTLFVANWAAATVAIVDTTARAQSGTIGVGKHPESLLLSRDGLRLFVTEPDDDTIGIIDVATRKRVAGVNVAPYDGALFGASPSALAPSADGKRLYVTLAAANAVAVVAVDGEPRLLGQLPAGWYPTAVSVEPDGSALDVVNGMGEGGRPNPDFKPFERSADRDASGYVATGMIGSIRRIPIPGDASLIAESRTVRAAAGPAFASHLAPPPGTIVRSHGPIAYVLYIVKENRTYDQVLGDIAGANGDPALTLFGERITPNEHAIARRFGVLDNTYADAEVSADGHNWSMAAFANDYLEHMWPQNYGGRRKLYDFEDGAVASTPHGGYIWDNAARHGVSLRNYGEFVSDPDRAGNVVSHMPDLAAVTDPRARGFDLSYDDNKRYTEWAREYDAYSARGTLPRLEILRLPNDHTAGTKAGALTPTAFVAQNDSAVGRAVEHVSHGKYWRNTAIFIVEDDAQNGPDHVDAQRMTAYVVTPYAKGGILHHHYSTAGVVSTIERILGLPPMSVYDAAALPLYDAFGTRANLRPYTALPETVDVHATNPPFAYRAKDAATLRFDREDRVSNATLNDLIWHAVRGARATAPPFGSFER